jgi:uncharacterized protein (TIGR03435 family)
MARTNIKLKAVVALLAVAVIAVAVAVKWVYFPSIKDEYFAPSQRSLRQVPFGLVVVRPTHFPKSVRKGITWDSVQVSGKQIWRVMGRNVTFTQLVAVAYGRNQDRVVVPPDVPKTNFDFLITVPGDLRTRLQAAIRKELGYVAHVESRDSDALAMKVQDPSLPGLTLSAAGSKPNVNFDHGRLYFTHMRVQMLAGGLEQAIKQPVVDKTDLTNFYDFSVSWDAQTQRQWQNDATAATAVKRILGGWGLALVPDNEQVEMLVVRSAG